jgi:hypothetical protein
VGVLYGIQIDRKLLNVVTVLYDVLMDREITEDYSVSDHRRRALGGFS